MKNSLQTFIRGRRKEDNTLKNTITKHDFIYTFMQSSERKDTFSYAGLEALFEYLEQLEEDTGEEIEFDMVGICCDYTEYKNFKEFQNDYNDIETLEELHDHTTVIPIENTYDKFIIEVF